MGHDPVVQAQRRILTPPRGAAPAHRGGDLGPALSAVPGRRARSTGSQVRTCSGNAAMKARQRSGDRQIGVLLRKSARSPVKLAKTKDGIAHLRFRIGVGSRP